MITIHLNGGRTKELGEGAWEAQKGHFPNDSIFRIDVPFGATVLVYQDFGFRGAAITLGGTDPMKPKEYNVNTIGAVGGVSCLRVESNPVGDVDMDMDF